MKIVLNFFSCSLANTKSSEPHFEQQKSFKCSEIIDSESKKSANSAMPHLNAFIRFLPPFAHMVHGKLLFHQIQIRINYIIICVYKSFYVCIVIGFNYGCWFAMRAKNRKSNHRFLSHPDLVRDLYTRCYTICSMRCFIICLGWTCVSACIWGYFSRDSGYGWNAYWCDDGKMRYACIKNFSVFTYNHIPRPPNRRTHTHPHICEYKQFSRLQQFDQFNS